LFVVAVVVGHFYLIFASIIPCQSFPGTPPAIFSVSASQLGVWANLRNCKPVQKKKKKELCWAPRSLSGILLATHDTLFVDHAAWLLF